jgi:hypothetical protein
MKINLRIGEIVIEGITLTRREREQLAATVQQEVARQLRQHGEAPGAQRDGGSALGLRIAHEVLAALPAGTFPGSAGLPVAIQHRPPGPAAPGPATTRPATTGPATPGAGR